MATSACRATVRAAKPEDLRPIEALLMESVPAAFAGIGSRVTNDGLLDVLLDLRRLYPDPVVGTLVAVIGSDIVGTMRLETAEMQRRAPGIAARLNALRPLGVRGAARFIAAAANANPRYRAGPDEAYLRSACVRPGLHKSGVATQLLRRIVDDAASLGCATATALIEEGNTASLALVHKVGFGEVGQAPMPRWARRSDRPRQLILTRDLT